MAKTLSIDRCPHHGWWAICISDDIGGTRLTPSKCCGRWDTVKAWPLDARMCRDAIEELSAALEELEKDVANR